MQNSRRTMFMDDLPNDAANRYPYDPTGDPTSEAFDYLRASERDGQPHIPTFALLMLEGLRTGGLLHTRDTETPNNIRRVRFDGKQEIWVRFGTRRTPRGYKAVEVMDTPRSDKAILAAMVAWTSDPVDFDQLRPAMAYTLALSTHKELFESTMDEAMRYLQEGKASFEEFKQIFESLDRFTRNQREVRNLKFLLPLIEYYRPQIDDYSPEEYWKLVEQACEHVKAVVESVNRLQSFLEYGVPNRKLTPAVAQ